jgi:phosphoglucomutase|tara:strand:- start:77 stop:1765 length:1689 start_codon:yes stop_codon:yes gene_type:complete
MNEILEKAKTWTLPPFDDKTIGLTKSLIEENNSDLVDSFYKNLEFGTGGLRGIMGVGTNRINKYTIGMATQGLANYLKTSFPDQDISVAIAHDSRNNSDYFTKVASNVLSGNGIEVFVFDGLRPTPQLSYTLRRLKCKAGIVITASHNPKEYNGYKVYWEDGGQLVPPHDKNVINEVQNIAIENIQFEGDENLITVLGPEMDQEYRNTIKDYLSEDVDLTTKIVYTSIHGTGVTQIPELLEEMGYNNVFTVKEQDVADGNFPTVISPNPEESEAMAMALSLGKEKDADIILGTDPDADRVGIAVKNTKGKTVLLNGNQTAAVMFYYILNKTELKPNHFVAKTIVTSELIAEIAKYFNVKLYNTLTGFKYIAEVINLKYGKEEFICGGEESYGYLIGDKVRDKDAVMSAAMLCETAAWAKSQGKSFYDLLLDIYVEVGFYREHLISITKKGKTGLEEIKAMMESYRNNPPSELGNIKVEAISDYQLSVKSNLTSGAKETITLPQSNVIQFHLADGSLITARPSGTEPKIKFYYSVKGELKSKENFDSAWAELGTKIETFSKDL